MPDVPSSPAVTSPIIRRSPGAARTPPNRRGGSPRLPECALALPSDASVRKLGADLQVSVPTAQQDVPVQPRPTEHLEVSPDVGSSLALQRLASSSAASATQTIPPALPAPPRVELQDSRCTTPQAEDRWLPPSQVDAKLWPGAATAGWSVMVRSKQSGHYWYISPQRVRYASRSQAQSAAAPVPLASLRSTASAALERCSSTDTQATVCAASTPTAMACLLWL